MKSTELKLRPWPASFGALCIALLAACAAPATGPADRIANTAWRLQSLPGAPVAEPARSTLRFFDRQVAGGSLGCNAYSTTWFADGGGLRFGAIAPTTDTCPAAVMQQEAGFREALRATRSARVDDGALLLMGEDGKVVARLVAL